MQAIRCLESNVLRVTSLIMMGIIGISRWTQPDVLVCHHLASVLQVRINRPVVLRVLLRIVVMRASKVHRDFWALNWADYLGSAESMIELGLELLETEVR